MLWPPNSPDLNPVDYEVWGVLQQRVYRSRIRDVDHFKQRLIKEWRCCLGHFKNPCDDDDDDKVQKFSSGTGSPG